MTSGGYCAKCKEPSAYLAPLHGERGGARCCLTCFGAWHAEHGRRRNRGRVAIRAMAAFLDAGGRVADLENLKLTAMAKDVPLFDLDPLGYLHGVAKSSDEVIELTLELLNDVLALVHPDKHPPERQELAQRVTAQLLAIKPFVFPRLVDKPSRKTGCNTSIKGLNENLYRSVTRYPCPTCSGTVPYFYCDTCKTTWEKRRREERERVNAAQRAAYARRRKPRQPSACADCGAMLEGRRRHARFWSTACRVRAHRAREKKSYTHFSVVK